MEEVKEAIKEVKEVPFMQVATIRNLTGYNYTTKSGAILQLNPSSSNCKLTIWEGMVTALYYADTDEKKKEIIDEALQSINRAILYVHIIRKDIYEFIIKNYETYGTVVCPIGYPGQNNMQYHIFIRNPRNSYARPVTEVVKAAPTVNIEHFGNKLKNLLKSKRRKTDIIDDIINLL